MFQISKKASTTISLVLAFLFMGGLIAAAVLLPFVLPEILAAGGRTQTAGVRILLTVLGYLAIALAAAADAMLFLLLQSIRQGKVFTRFCVAMIRYISWCLILFGLVFLPVGFLLRFAWVIAFAGLFLGLCLRVVKNCFEEATAIKEENDLTV